MSGQPATLQDFPYEAALQAIKDSLKFTDFPALQQHLLDNLPQNSPVTRQRYANLIIRWFFPDHQLGGLLPRVWQAYGDERILRDLTRVTILEIEPVIARFVTDVILLLPSGAVLPANTARDYIVSTYGGYKKNSHSRLLLAARYLGFLDKANRDWIVAADERPATALLLWLHAKMAPTPRIVRLSDLLAMTFWRFLGFREADHVRSVLRDAEAAGLIARYSVVDQLEQLTTRHTLDAFLRSAYRLPG